MANLFILDVTYVAGLTEIDRHLQGHRAYLDEHCSAGTFLVAGRKEPRTGGVIVAWGEREQIERLVTTDPYVQHGVARYSVTEVVPTKAGELLASLVDVAPSVTDPRS